MSGQSKATLRAHILIVAIAGVSSLAVLYSTRHGPWVKSDSVEYLQVAENFLAGRGLTIAQASGEYSPVTLHPPGYSLLLAAAMSAGIDALDAARWSGALLIAATTILLGVGVLALTRSPIAGAGLALTYAFSSVILDVHAGVMSEALFFFGCFGGLAAVIAYASTSRPSWFAVSCLLIAAATLARFGGLVAAGTACLTILLVGSSPPRRRIAATLLMAAACVLPLLAWRLGFTPNTFSLQRASPGLSLLRLWDGLEPLRGALVDSLWNWNTITVLIPGLRYTHKVILLLLACLAFVLGIALLARRHRKEHPDWYRKGHFTLLAVCLTYATLYVLFYAASYAMTGFELNLDSRLFAPLWVALLLTFITAASLLGHQSNRPASRWGLPLLATLLFMPPAVIPTPALLARLHSEGEGYTSLAWRQSALIARVAALPNNTPIITNESAAVLFLTGRAAYDIAEIDTPAIPDTSGTYGEDLSDPIQALFREGEPALVLFRSAYWELWPKYREDTQSRLDVLVRGLLLWADESDGAIYFYR